LAARAAICVAQFIKDPNYKEKLKELAALDSYERRAFIEKGAGTKCPGNKSQALM